MPGRSTRSSIREELKRAAGNQDAFCKHMMVIDSLCDEAQRPEMKEKFQPLSVVSTSLKELCISLRETI